MSDEYSEKMQMQVLTIHCKEFWMKNSDSSWSYILEALHTMYNA
jgi:hypothetical protein